LHIYVRDIKNFSVKSDLNIAVGTKSAAKGCHLQSGHYWSIHMPKMKTKSSAKKRFRVRPGGTVKSGMAFKRHILTKKTTKNKRQLRGTRNINASDVTSVLRMMPTA
jgi:large subunit ribosomal protein L35